APPVATRPRPRPTPASRPSRPPRIRSRTSAAEHVFTWRRAPGRGPFGGPVFLLPCPPLMPWSPTSWQDRPASQQPTYPDPDALARVVAELSRLPPLVTSWEIEALKGLLARAGRGEQFLLQGGDCAESFEDCESDQIAAKLKILLQMSLVLVHGGRRGVIRVGRIAGQYAKPRSADTERRGDLELP